MSAGKYYLHDKDALTNERVGFTHTENLPTDDPELGMRWMAYTAMNADELKRQAEVAQTGRKASKPVFCFSLSWHPEEQPDREHMIGTGRSALAAIGLQDHQVVMVSHTDENHSHLHLICNLVNPEHGKTHTLQYSRKRLSAWAEEYERTHSQKIYCEQRVENNQRRKDGEKNVKYQDPELNQKAALTKLYQDSEDGQAFLAAATAAGFTVAQGKRIVLLDSDGKMHNLARQLEGVREKDVRAFLDGIELPQVDDARKRQEEERGKQAVQPKTEEDEKQERRQPEEERENQQEQRVEDGAVRAQADVPASAQQTPEARKASPDPAILNRMQNRQRDELSHFLWEEASAARSQLERDLDRLYGEQARRWQEKLSECQQALRDESHMRFVHSAAQMMQAIVSVELAEIEACKQTARQALDNSLKDRADSLMLRHAQEREALQNGILPQKTELAQVYDRAAETQTSQSPVNATTQVQPVADKGMHAFLDQMEGRSSHTNTAVPQQHLTGEFAGSAQAQVPEDPGMSGFLDRLEGRGRQPHILTEQPLQAGPLASEFATAADSLTPEEEAMNSFLDRIQQEQEQEFQKWSQTSKPRDEYSFSLGAEFDAATGEGYSGDTEALNAFLGRMEGEGMAQSLSMDSSGPE